MIRFTSGSLFKVISLCKSGRRYSDEKIAEMLFPNVEYTTNYIGHVKDCTKNLPDEITQYMSDTDQEEIIDTLNRAVRKVFLTVISSEKQPILIAAIQKILEEDLSIADSTQVGYFLNLLIPKLPSPQDDDLSQGILETIDLDSYRTEARETMSIQLDDADSEMAPVPAGKSGHIVSPEMDLLSIIVSEFNDMFGNIDWKEPDNARRQILEIPAMVSKDEKYRNAMRNSDEQSAKLESERALQQVIFSIMADNMEIFKQYQDNPSFKKWLSDLVFNLTYNKEGNTYEAPTTGKVTSYQNVDTPTLMVAESKTEYKIEK